MQVKGSRGPAVWPLALTIVGVVLLLNNFLLLEPFNVAVLWPLLLVVIGAVILLRGDFLPDDSTRTFGITRGSVASGVLEINSGEIDIRLKGLEREGRLIAGQYAANARPELNVQDTHAHLRLDRAATSWITFSDWDMALAQDLPWQLLISSSIGQVDMDLSNLIVDGGIITTGISDIRVICPQETLNPLQINSNIGNIQLVTPLGYKTRIKIEGSPTFGIRVDERRYALTEPGLYVARDAEPDNPIIDIHVSGVFGDVYLA